MDGEVGCGERGISEKSHRIGDRRTVAVALAVDLERIEVRSGGFAGVGVEGVEADAGPDEEDGQEADDEDGDAVECGG